MQKKLKEKADRIIELQTILLREDTSIQEKNKAESEIMTIVLSLQEKMLNIDAYIEHELTKMQKQGMFKPKPVIYLDFDNTLFKTTEAVIREYNKEFKNSPGFQYIKYPEDLKYYYMKETCECASTKWIFDIFSDPRVLNDKLNPEDGMINALTKKLKDKYNMRVVSMCQGTGTILKKQIIENEIPFCSFEPVDYRIYKNKAHINMSNSIFIDDNIRYLTTSNAKLKILFKPVDHNRYDEFKEDEEKAINNKEVVLCQSWNEILELLLNFDLSDVEK